MALLDRLVEGVEVCDERAFAARGSRKGANALKASVLRDLAWMLNARRPGDPVEAADPRRGPHALQGTLARFGLPDITHLDLDQEPDRRTLQRWIKEAVRAFEPRLSDVDVSWSEAGAGHFRSHFRVSAKLQVEPSPERLSFDGEVLWRTRELRLR